MSMEVLGKKIGLTQPHISRIESGHAGLRSAHVKKLCRALKIHPAELYSQCEGSPGPSRCLKWALKNPEFSRFLHDCARKGNTDKKFAALVMAVTKALWPLPTKVIRSLNKIPEESDRARQTEIISAAWGHCNMAAAGRELGLTRERVRQICKQHGISWTILAKESASRLEGL
jgi:hypothetical protein